MSALKFWLCGKAEKESYQVLDYSHRNLLNVPTDIYEHAQTLEDLYLDANQLKDLPKALFSLQHLKLLNISDNEIIALPSNVSNLSHLIQFDISKNGFLDLPDSIKGLKSLEHFDLSVNPLGRLPDEFTMLLNLTHVYLNDTFLDFLPANIGRMSKLEILEVRDNHLTMIPKSMSRLQNLKRLDIGNNDFNEVPEVVGTFTSLEELWLDGNKLKVLPAELGNLGNLVYLDATDNAIEWVAEEIGNCESLTDLHLTTNSLVQLPETICNLKQLETLKVDDNNLSSLPTSIGGLSSLEELICCNNELLTLPPGIGLLRKLQTLNADENYIGYLPEEIGSCVSLSVVSLRQNRLQILPDDFGRLSNLAVLNLSSNLLDHLPYTLMKLKKLKALWLSENQAKPLIPLQTDWDSTNERRFLTCYMFPQRPSVDSYESEGARLEEQSFHASLFEEEWRKRTSVVFDLDESDPQTVHLSRQPTPFPKDVRDKINHYRNQAIAKGQLPGNHGQNHAVGAHIEPRHPYVPADAVETKLHGNYSHKKSSVDTTLDSSTSSSSDCNDSVPYGSHAKKNNMSAEEKELLKQLNNTSLNRGLLNAPNNINSPYSPNSAKDEDFNDLNHLSEKRGIIKLSADSGLGSTDLSEDQNTSWKNEYPAIPEQEEVFRVTIVKTPHLGFSVSGGIDSPGNPYRHNDKGIFVTKVLLNGPANGLLQPGDKILEVNGQNFQNIIHEDAVNVLKSCDRVELIVSRRHNDVT